ncbi:MAG: pilus assembly protein TadG-related protein [Acidimicrobiia bacterium]
MRTLDCPERERGAIMVLACVGVVVATIAAGLSIDIGRLALTRRDNQRVADLAALDAVRVLGSGAELQAARESAHRNAFPWDAAGHDLSVELGTVSGGGFVAGTAATATALRVRVTSPVANQFVSGRTSVTARAVASMTGPMGTVAVGSTLAGVSGTVGSTDVRILNRLLSHVVSPGTVNVDAVGWKGIADGTVTFDRLRAALGLTAGSVDGALDTSITFRRLLNATVDALNADGSPTAAAAATPLATIAAQVATTMGASFTLRELFGVTGTVSDGTDLAQASLRVLDIVRGGAILADGDHFASFDLAASELGPIPGLNFARVKVGLIEAPQVRSGPPGTDGAGTYLTTASTAQIRVLIEVHLRVLLSGLGLTDVRAPYYLEAGSARAHLDTMVCTAPGEPARVDIRAETDLARARLGSVADSQLATAASPVLSTTRLVSVAGLVTVDTDTVLTATAPGNPGTTLSFYPPYTADAPPQSVSAATVTLPAVSVSSVTANVLVLGLNAGLIELDTVNGITAAVPGVRAEIVEPLYRALGLSHAKADVWAPPPQDCASTLVNAGGPGAFSIPALVG